MINMGGKIEIIECMRCDSSIWKFSFIEFHVLNVGHKLFLSEKLGFLKVCSHRRVEFMVKQDNFILILTILDNFLRNRHC